MLEITTSTTFIPGSNLKGNVTGANWLFLLPKLKMNHAVCVGLPLTSTLLALSKFCQDVTVICLDESQEERLDLVVEESGLRNVEVMIARHTSALLLPAQSADLLLMSGRAIIGWLNQHPDFCAELFRLLAPDGFLYHEYVGPSDPFKQVKRMGNVVDAASIVNPQTCQLWLTPLGGEMHTAVPRRDASTMHFFRQNRLYSPSINKQLLQRVGAALGGGVRRKATTPAKATNAPATPVERRVASAPKRSLRSMAKLITDRFLQTMDTAEERLGRQPVVGTWVQRHGVLQGPGMGDLAYHPPHYLRQIARIEGVDLNGLRWGLSASGEYSSRKLIFFLFDRENAPSGSDADDLRTIDETPRAGRKPHEVNAAEPKYIVKMVRDSIFNARLENECRSLRALSALGVGDLETLPQVVFAGHHDGLALVGESAVSGVPFRQASHFSADCPYAHAAIDWLTDMAVKTVNPTGQPRAVGALLRTLFAQFDEIYQLASEQRTFLANQIAQIEQSRFPIPLVFQHGDPGTWNMMATPGGRVAILDWEAAESKGMPLWDLFYFLRSYTVGVAQAQNPAMEGAQDSITSFQQQIFQETPLRQLFCDATATYCQQIGLDVALAGPLFYMCWMHRALKEATRLPHARLNQGHYVNLLYTSIKEHNAVKSLWPARANG